MSIFKDPAHPENIRELARQLGILYRHSLVDNVPAMRELSHLIPYTFAKKQLAIAIEQNPDEVTIAIADPLNLQALDDLKFMLDRPIICVVAPMQEIQQMIDEVYQKQEESHQFLADLEEKLKSHNPEDQEVIYDLLGAEEHIPVIKLFNLILTQAIAEGASDIHLEPAEEDLKVRFRLDGVLQTKPFPLRDYQQQLLTRIKVLAKLDIAEHRLPQDGRMKIAMGARQIDFRVSTIPIAHGERIVLRLLDKGNVLLGLNQLGFLPKVLDRFRHSLSNPEGMLLVTGPTGSGKTTTLYSALQELCNDEINIMTIEDPVEYKIQGISQIAVHPKIGFNFVRGLRHILRQDPDIVMVGEIRDTETAEMAVQASLTGHLVLSTLHTNDASSAIPRLIDMGIAPYLISSTLLGVMAQRLVRRICPHCRQSYRPDGVELDEIGLTQKELTRGVLYRGEGCSACSFSGYQGRHGIYEFLPISPSLQSLIAQRPSAQEVQRCAETEGILLSLKEHGKHLVRTGITTTREIVRVTKKGLIGDSV